MFHFTLISRWKTPARWHWMTASTTWRKKDLAIASGRAPRSVMKSNRSLHDSMRSMTTTKTSPVSHASNSLTTPGMWDTWRRRQNSSGTRIPFTWRDNTNISVISQRPPMPPFSCINISCFIWNFVLLSTWENINLRCVLKLLSQCVCECVREREREKQRARVCVCRISMTRVKLDEWNPGVVKRQTHTQNGGVSLISDQSCDTP